MSRGQYGRQYGKGRRGLRVAGVVDDLKIERLTVEYNELYRSLSAQAKTRPDWAGWFKVAVEPVFKVWHDFLPSAGEHLDPATYTSWSNKLSVIREGAKAFGMKPATSLGGMALIGAGVVLGLGVLAVAVRNAS